MLMITSARRMPITITAEEAPSVGYKFTDCHSGMGPVVIGSYSKDAKPPPVNEVRINSLLKGLMRRVKS